jgi:hypothetical protein
MAEDRTNLSMVLRLFQQVTVPLRDFPAGPLSHYADTLLCLASEAMGAYSALWLGAVKAPNIHNPTQYAAFMTRNLLELAVWTEYCAKSKENAEQFRQDAVRDANGLLSAYQKLASLLRTEPANGFADARDRLQRVSGLLGIDDADTGFKFVSEAAKESGTDSALAFRALNTILSKYTHPTAFAVKVLTDSDDVRGWFLIIGTALICAVLSEIAMVVPSLTGRGYAQPFDV